MSVAGWFGSLVAGELSTLKERLAPVFLRRELKEAGSAFLDGLLSGLPLKTVWLMAERPGVCASAPDTGAVGALIASADEVRDFMRGNAAEEGERSVRVGRQLRPRTRHSPEILWLPCNNGVKRTDAGTLCRLLFGEQGGGID